MRPGGTARSLSRKREGVMDLQHGRLPLPLAGEGRGEGGAFHMRCVVAIAGDHRS
jgi:hypothetical protein